MTTPATKPTALTNIKTQNNKYITKRTTINQPATILTLSKKEIHCVTKKTTINPPAVEKSTLDS